MLRTGSTGQIFWSTSIYDTTLYQYANLERTKNYNFLVKGYQGGNLKVNTDLEAIFLSIKQEYQESLFNDFTLNINRMGKISSFDNEKKIITSYLILYSSTMTMFISKEIKDKFNDFFRLKRIAIKAKKEDQIKEIEKKIRILNDKINKQIGLIELSKGSNKNISIDEHIISTGLAFEPAIQIDMNTTLYQYIIYIKKASDRIKAIKAQQSNNNKKK